LIDGRVSEEFYKEEHELDYERMKAAEAREGEKERSRPDARGRETKDDYDISPAGLPGD
jgi:hypothetical protein